MFLEPRDAWRHEANEPSGVAFDAIHQLGVDAAGESFELIRRGRPEALADSPHPRVRALYVALVDAEFTLAPTEPL